MESYYTLQGEGYNTGMAAYFIRLGGCDVGCVWCDVKESWDAKKYSVIEIKQIVEQAKKYPAKNVVITGGEPLMYNLDKLCTLFHQQKIKTFLETSGAYPMSGKWDWICISPKKFKLPLPENLALANELKVIIYNTSDFAWAEKNASHVSGKCKLYLQPEWSKAKKIIPLIIDFVKKNPQWKISLQTHKFLNIP